jgi:uncharacterized membrane protein
MFTKNQNSSVIIGFGVMIAYFCCGFASHAEAAMLFSNRTNHTIDVAIGYYRNHIWMSEGWWRIEPGLDTRIRVKQADAKNTYYYAATRADRGGKGQVWAGNTQFCISSEKAFRAEGSEGCAVRGLLAKGFAKAPIHPKTRDFKLVFSGNNGK